MTKQEPLVLPVGYEYFWYDEIGSTNKEAFKKRENGLPGDGWICSKVQTSGRGTKGTGWISEDGNLYASLLTLVSCTASDLTQISLLAGLAATTAIEKFASNNFHIDDLCLKWPNDVLLQGQKVCGILVESRPSNHFDASAGQFDVVVGFGINILHNPQIEGLFPAGNLEQHGWTCSREQLFVSLVQSTRDWFTIWRNGRDFETLRLAWLERSCHIGHSINIKVGKTEFEGRFTTISSNGALVLENEAGEIKNFSSGHIISVDSSRLHR